MKIRKIHGPIGKIHGPTDYIHGPFIFVNQQIHGPTIKTFTLYMDPKIDLKKDFRFRQLYLVAKRMVLDLSNCSLVAVVV